MLGITSMKEWSYEHNKDGTVNWFMTLATFGGKAIMCECGYGKQMFPNSHIKYITDLDLHTAVCANCERPIQCPT